MEEYSGLGELERSIAERLERADRLAEEYAIPVGGKKIIGRVSRSTPSRMSEGEAVIVAELDPRALFSADKEALLGILSTNTYLGVVDVKTCEIIVARLVGAERLDAAYAIQPSLQVPRIEVEEPEPGALVSTPKVHLKPVLVFDPETGEARQASYIVDPQSPVFAPNPEFLPKMLGLPVGPDVAVVGALTVGDVPIVSRAGDRPLAARVGIPFHALLKHVFVVGTTGAGKTTMLKNLVYSLLRDVVVSGERPVVMVFDANRDYLSVILRPRWRFPSQLVEDRERTLAEAVYGSPGPGKPPSPVILVPAVKGLSVEEWVSGYVKDHLGEIAESMGHGVSLESVEYRGSGGMLGPVKASLKIDGEEKSIILIPFALEYRGDPRKIIGVDPYMTDQARELLPTVVKIISEAASDSRDFVRWFAEKYRKRAAQDLYQRRLTAALTSLGAGSLEALKRSLDNSDVQLYLRDVVGIHPSTIDNIRRRIVSLANSGLFDVYMESGTGSLRVGGADIGLAASLAGDMDRLVIVDLAYARRVAEERGELEPETIVNMLAYHVLSRLFEYVKRGERRMILVVDEAHSFFPAERGRSTEYAARVAGLITRIARLGRSRGLGIVFATHSIRDVNDRILLLTNTKIVFRVDEAMAQALELPPEYRRIAPLMGDRVGVIKSYYLRGGIVSFRTPMPMLGHRDISAV